MDLNIGSIIIYFPSTVTPHSKKFLVTFPSLLKNKTSSMVRYDASKKVVTIDDINNGPEDLTIIIHNILKPPSAKTSDPFRLEIYDSSGILT